MLIVCCTGQGTAGGGGSCYHLVLFSAFQKACKSRRGGKRSQCNMTCHLASLSTLRTVFLFFIFWSYFIYLILLLFLPRPGLAQDTSAPRKVGPARIAPSRAQSPPRSLLPNPPHFGATTSLRPLPPLHHLYRPVLSEGLMSPAPPSRRPLPSPEPPRPRPPSPPCCPCLSLGPLPTNRTPQ